MSKLQEISFFHRNYDFDFDTLKNKSKMKLKPPLVKRKADGSRQSSGGNLNTHGV